MINKICHRPKWRTIILLVLCHLSISATLVGCVDNNDDVPENYYTANKMTAAEFLQSNDGRLGDFIRLLKRTPYFSLLSTYGEFTVFAPTDEALERYLRTTGYGAIDNIPQAVCDTLARTHIIKKGSFFTTDSTCGNKFSYFSCLVSPFTKILSDIVLLVTLIIQ